MCFYCRYFKGKHRKTISVSKTPDLQIWQSLVPCAKSFNFVCFVLSFFNFNSCFAKNTKFSVSCQNKKGFCSFECWWVASDTTFLTLQQIPALLQFYCQLVTFQTCTHHKYSPPSLFIDHKKLGFIHCFRKCDEKHDETYNAQNILYCKVTFYDVVNHLVESLILWLFVVFSRTFKKHTTEMLHNLLRKAKMGLKNATQSTKTPEVIPDECKGSNESQGNNYVKQKLSVTCRKSFQGARTLKLHRRILFIFSNFKTLLISSPLSFNILSVKAFSQNVRCVFGCLHFCSEKVITSLFMQETGHEFWGNMFPRAFLIVIDEIVQTKLV